MNQTSTLGWVWHDYHFTPSTPPHPTPPRNSTSTRNNDPRGLKFCGRPYQAKLTTIQLNFNPTIFGRGGVIHPSLRLTQQIFLTLNFFDIKIFLTQHFFWHKIFFDTKIFWTQNFLTIEFFLNRNLFDPKNFST